MSVVADGNAQAKNCDILVKPSLAGQMFNDTPRRSGVLLDSNEFRFPLPSRLLERIAEEIQLVDLRHYPDPGEANRVKLSLSSYLDVEPANLLLGVGSMELLDLIPRAFGENDYRIVVATPTFPLYAKFASLNDKRLVTFPLEDDFSLSSEIAAKMLAVQGPKLILVCSPNNPTGLTIGSAIFDMLASDPASLLCIDEAYVEYAENSFVSEAVRRPNVMVTRSLSKIGLAGCRFGYLIASEALIRETAKAALPYLSLIHI